MLGFVSLLMDVSSEMIHSLLPVFMVGVLGASALMVGVVEGVAEATALAVKVFSGVWSDRSGRRKPLALLGYGLGALAKPLFALAGGMGLVLAARFVDRIGKGLRGAPRDALVADLTPRAVRGAAYGLRQSLDTVGAFVGPALAIALMLAWDADFRAVFWFAVGPAVLAVALLAFGVEEPHRADGSWRATPSPGTAARPVPPWGRDALARFPRAYWAVVIVGAVFALARFSEAFLVLRAQQTGLQAAWAPLVMIGMNVVYALAAYPFGRLADRIDHRVLLALGLVVLIAADVLLAASTHAAGLAAGVALWGLHMGMTQGLLATMVADTAPADLRGTAFGVFNLASGAALLAASITAGALWDAIGAPATFAAGAAFAALALAGLPFVPRAAGARGADANLG